MFMKKTESKAAAKIEKQSTEMKKKEFDEYQKWSQTHEIKPSQDDKE